jgi:hypothetical protein
MSGAIIFNSILVNGQETVNGIFVGETVASGWASHNKNQLSVGQVFTGFGAANFFPANYFLIFDNDLIDTLISDPDPDTFSPQSVL